MILTGSIVIYIVLKSKYIFVIYTFVLYIFDLLLIFVIHIYLNEMEKPITNSFVLIINIID